MMALGSCSTYSLPWWH